MARPCTCDIPFVQHEDHNEGCRLCWLWHYDFRYRRLWSDEKEPIPAFLLNLKRRPDRLTLAQQQFAKTKVKPRVIEGVDGRALPLPDEWREAGAGAYGCSLGHRRIIETALTECYPVIMVYEDDCVLADDFDIKLDNLLKILPPDFDAVFLGAQMLEAPLTTEIPGLLKCENCHRTHAYILSNRNGYMSFLYKTWNLIPGHIDHTWGQYQKNWKVYAPTEWLAGQSGSLSDINGRQGREKWWTVRRVKQGEGCNECQKKAARNVRPNRNNEDTQG